MRTPSSSFPVLTMPITIITIIHNAMIMVISEIILVHGTVMPEMSCVCKFKHNCAFHGTARSLL